MDKLGRAYQFFVQVGPVPTDLLKVELPFTIEFDIVKNTLGKANHASFRIYNLSKANRSLIRFDQTNIGIFRSVILIAGYGKNLSVIFKGNISQAWSVREGVNWITNIECYDGGAAFTNAVTDVNFVSGTPIKDILLALIGSLNVPNLGNIVIGKIGNIIGEIARGNSYSDSTTDILTDVSGKSFFIDNGVANVLQDNECLKGTIQVINDTSGIINTPTLEFTFVNVDTIFAPQLVMGQLIMLNSKLVDASFNRQYKIVALKHNGMISETICGDAISHIQLSPGTGSLQVIL